MTNINSIINIENLWLNDKIVQNNKIKLKI